MMGRTHAQLAAAWWLGEVCIANAAHVGINPIVALVGAVIAPVFAHGVLSPDADVTWLAFLGHRQETHRPDTTAAFLTVLSGVGWVFLVVLGLPLGVAALAWAPVSGWWSHLAGDMVFGRIPVGRRLGAVLARRWAGRTGVDGKPVVIRSSKQLIYWVGYGLDTDGLIERGNVYVEELPWWVRIFIRRPGRTKRGLKATIRVLPIAPTGVALSVATIMLWALAAVTWWVNWRGVNGRA